MRVEWTYFSDNGRNCMRAWLVCDVEGREAPVTVLHFGIIAADDLGNARAELAFWRNARNELSSEHIYQPEIKDGALTLTPRPYAPGERDAIEQEISQTVPIPDNWETTQSWVDRAAELAKGHTYYLPRKRLS